MIIDKQLPNKRKSKPWNDMTPEERERKSKEIDEKWKT
jgi:hypothetical protein